MPYLRYSRDKRGYEHTYVLHGSRAGGRPSILYWFRTPPHVVVGRDALDEEATKAIEASNPELDFDWSQMRRERPKPPSRAAAMPGRMQKRNRRSGPTPVTVRPEVSGEVPPVVEVEAKTDIETVSEVSPESSVEVAAPESDGITSEEHPVSALLGDQMLVKLRSVFADLDQRLQGAQLTESLNNQLRSRIDSLNPDNWLAGEEVVLRIEQFDSEVAEIQVLLSDN